MWLDDERTALYRLYDANGRLLYIGITSRPETCFAQHAMNKQWWPQVSRRAVQWFDDRPSAAAAEAAAIRAEDPERNATYSPRFDRRTAQDVVRPDGVREITVALARKAFGDVVAHVRYGGKAAILMNRKKPGAVLIPYDFYARACEALGLARVPIGDDDST